MPSRFVQVVSLIAFLALTLAAGAVAGLVTVHEIPGWYATLRKPPFNPPNEVFGPMWTTLYILMAIAAWRVWRHAGLASRPLVLFFAQLAVNFAWSFIFFSRHLPLLALADLGLLWILIAMTAVAFARFDRPAALLFLPYLAWVSFAGVLNAAIVRLN